MSPEIRGYHARQRAARPQRSLRPARHLPVPGRPPVARPSKSASASCKSDFVAPGDPYGSTELRILLKFGGRSPSAPLNSTADEVVSGFFSSSFGRDLPSPDTLSWTATRADRILASHLQIGAERSLHPCRLHFGLFLPSQRMLTAAIAQFLHTACTSPFRIVPAIAASLRTAPNACSGTRRTSDREKHEAPASSAAPNRCPL
jgi:hypothetical protein